MLYKSHFSTLILPALTFPAIVFFLFTFIDIQLPEVMPAMLNLTARRGDLDMRSPSIKCRVGEQNGD